MSGTTDFSPPQSNLYYFEADFLLVGDFLRISCVQLDMEFCNVERNYKKAEELITSTARNENPDLIVLPETWSTGYFPREDLEKYCEDDCSRVKSVFSALARDYGVNIAAGSVANIKNGGIFNTACVFDRDGRLVAEYDKTHLFTPMDEHKYFNFGSNVVTFELDGKKCGIVICYDIRFPELIRTLALEKIELLIMSSQWPDKRVNHLQVLTQARAIENQMFVACCNSCGTADGAVFGGSSQIIDPWGKVLARAGEKEEVITADCDFDIIKEIRNSINVFHDRRTEIYRI